MPYQEKLDNAIERVKQEFLARILDFNNNETEYVCQELAVWFDSQLELLRDAQARETESQNA